MAKNPTRIDPRRSPATQPYRVTKNAQRIARRIAAYEADGRTLVVVPAEAVLGPRTREMLATFDLASEDAPNVAAAGSIHHPDECQAHRRDVATVHCEGPCRRQLAGRRA